MSGLRPTELIVLGLAMFAVAIMGLVANRWRRPAAPIRLDDWSLGARQYGSWASWFVVGSVVFTGYGFVAGPALAFTEGAAAFYVLPYLIIAFPLAMLPLVRLWSVSRARGYLTVADFVRGRYGSGVLAGLVAVTGIVAPFRSALESRATSSFGPWWSIRVPTVTFRTLPRSSWVRTVRSSRPRM